MTGPRKVKLGQLDGEPGNRSIMTFKRWAFDITDQATWAFDIDDIATSLGNICRFNGHVYFYSVAEHSVRVAELVGREYGIRGALVGLLHDATEAYMGDIPKPQKDLLSIDGIPYSEIEENMTYAIMASFGINTAGEWYDDVWQAVKKADYKIYLYERDQRPASGANVTPKQARWLFKERYMVYSGQAEERWQF